MSFGWSAGDIAQAIALVVKVVRALDGVDGAGASYCEAVAFLTRLKRTLEPLQTVSALRLLPNYADNIRELVDEIQDPISHFLALTAEFEQLGSHSKHHQHIVKKLQWRFKTSKKVDELRRGIESRLGILDSFLQRVTLETVVSMEAKLGEQLRRNFQEVVDPRLVSILQQQLQPVTERLVETQMLSQQLQEEILSKLDYHTSTVSDRTMRHSAPSFHSASQSEYDAMLSNFERIEISQDAAVNTIKQHITCAINDFKSDYNHEIGGNLVSRRKQIAMRRRRAELDQPLKALETPHHEIRTCGSLEDLYYLVLIYLGYFLRDIFMTLAENLKPVPVLTPTLLAKYHISFYDALGSPPRILDINCFARYKVFTAFLEGLYPNTLGAYWVSRGLYTLIDQNNKELSPASWSESINPGIQVMMYLRVEGVFLLETRCPAAFCYGSLQKRPGSYSSICSGCGMEIRTENRGRIGAPNTGAMPAYHDDGSKQTSSIMGPFKAPEIYRESHEDINPFNKGVAFKRVQRRQIKPPSLLNWNHRESFKAFATQLPTVTPRPSCLDLASCNLSTKRSPQASFERKRDKKVVYRWGMQFCIDSEATLQHYIEMGQTGVIIVKPKNRLMNKLQKGSKEKAPQIIKETLSLLNRSPIPPADFSAPLFFDRPRRLKDRVKTSYVKFGNRSNTFGPGDYATKY